MKDRPKQNWKTPASQTGKRKTLIRRPNTLEIQHSLFSETKDELRLLKTSIETISTGITIADIDGKILYTNPAEAMIHGYTVEELVGMNVGVFSPDKRRKRRNPNDVSAWKEWTREVIEIRKDRTTFPVQLKSIPVRDPDGNPTCIITISEDITLRKQSEEALRNAHNELEQKVLERTRQLSESNRMLEQELLERQAVENRLRLLGKFFENTNEAVLITDHQAKIIEVNDAFTRITGFEKEEVIGRRPTVLRSYRNSRRAHMHIWKSILRRGSWQGEVWDKRKNGEIYPVWLSIGPVRDDTNAVSHYVAIAADISAIKKTEERLEHLAHHDSLTNLPNRILFSDRLTQAVALARRNKKMLAVMLLDLDRFKEVNDTLGHRLGDQLLVDVSRRLRYSIREADTISRLGGDEFAVILSDITDIEKAAQVAQHFMQAVSEPFEIEGHKIYITTSIGITIYPADSDEMEPLLKNADTAMYYAKSMGKNNFQFFTSEMNRRIIEKLFIESKLRHALELGEFQLYFQPQIETETETTVGMEALLRWVNPELGDMPPSRFIPIAEDTGLIIPIGEWVIREACRQAKAWQDDGVPTLNLSINLSARQFHKQTIVETISSIISETGFDPRHLELEITESVIMQDVDDNIRTLRRLKDLGLRLSIDDFGTGYSSLNYLKRFPIDVLKIDQSFVRDISSGPDNSSVVSAIIALAHSLNLKVIAEGVETAEQLAFLKERGCNEVQGFYFSKPIPGHQVKDLFRKGQKICRPPLKGLMRSASCPKSGRKPLPR
ncbi:MAG: EAL domain-containing protein [Nitrospirae bacterium]|nr:EAL domain-containing protein [Nitrospirota bacterium]